MGFHRDTLRYGKQIANYIVNYGKFGDLSPPYGKISKRAVSQMSLELDSIIRDMSEKLRTHILRNSLMDDVETVTKKTVMSVFPLSERMTTHYDDVVSQTFFKRDYLSSLFIKYTKFPSLQFTDNAYEHILKCLYKRFDDIIEVSIMTTNSLCKFHTEKRNKRNIEYKKINSRVVENSANCVRLCLEEN